MPIEYSIEYFYKGKKIKKCDKCFESAVVKVPQFKLNPAASIQFQGHVFDVLAKDNIKNTKKVIYSILIYKYLLI